MAKLQVLFEGTDSLNRKNLWVTDGTAAGTSELTITGVSSSGLLSAGDPDFTALAGCGKIRLVARNW
jgi:ELWxxDGT repeat protein